MANAERNRLEEVHQNRQAWYNWGPYLSERHWGTVREDYSPGGAAWDFLTHDQSRSHAYRWGEDGIMGISNDRQQLCFALALWNGADPILKERIFGLTNSEGNHGEDVKEYYSTSTSSRPTAAGAAARSSTNSSTPAYSIGTATSTCSSSTPRSRPRTSWSRS